MKFFGETLFPSKTLSFPPNEPTVDFLSLSARGRILEQLSGRVALVLVSAGLLTCSLPEPDIGWLAWVALVPLFIACNRVTPLRAAALGFLSGTAANIGIYHWLFAIHGFGIHHFLILSTFFALYPTMWCAGISWLNRRGSSLLFSAPAFWVALDYVRAHAGFMAFPWGTLAHTQHQNLAVLQVATLAGEYGVTFLVVMANALIARILLHRAWRGTLVAAFVIAVVHIYGIWVLHSESPGPTIRVAAIQPSIGLRERDTPAGRAAILNRLDQLTRAAAASHPALIAWPETAVTGNPRANPFFAAGLLELANEIQTQIVLGVGEVEKFATRDPQGKMVRRAYNSAYVLTPGKGLGAPYVKRVLLPFGEYVPLESVIGWPAWLAPPVFDTVVGNKPSFFGLLNGTIFSPLICWENLFSDLARESVRGGSRLLVLVANDGWFGLTAEPYQHNLASVLRAVENRVPIVVSSNTGPSEIIDPFGRVVANAPKIFTANTLTAEVELGSTGTPYTRIGDVFTLLVALGLGLGVVRQLCEVARDR